MATEMNLETWDWGTVHVCPSRLLILIGIFDRGTFCIHEKKFAREGCRSFDPFLTASL